MRILWSSNAFWAKTGYGVQAQYLLPRLQQLGHEVAQFAWYGLQGATLKVGGLTMYPAVRHAFGIDVIGAHVRDFKADLVISLQDIWPLPEDYVNLFEAAWAPWFPVDHDPLPEAVLKRAKTAHYPIVYSKFGQEIMRKAGVECHYIPHGVETSVFKPGDQKAARQTLGLPESGFMVDMVAANKSVPSRKALAENIEAFAIFHEKYPDSFLYLHTEISGGGEGLELDKVIAALGLEPGKDVFYVPQYRYLTGLPDTFMATVYQASDCHLSASTSEGFGIPILEAQACGTPVITTNFASMPELTWCGIAVEPYQRIWTPMNSWVAAVPVDGVRAALEEIYNWPHKTANKKCEWAVKCAKEYDWDYLTLNYWEPFLQMVEGTLTPKDAAV